MRPCFLLAVTLYIAMFSAAFADDESWKSACCYCLAASNKSSAMQRCEKATEQICRVLMPKPDNCDTIPTFGGAIPSAVGGGSAPGGGPCCSTCYCFSFFGVLQELRLEELVAMGDVPGYGNVDQLAKLVYDHAQERRELGDNEATYRLLDVAEEMYLNAISQQLSKGRGSVYGQNLLNQLGHFSNTSDDTKLLAQTLTRGFPRFAKHLNVGDGSVPVEKEELRPNKLVQLFHDYQSCLAQSALLSPNSPQEETAKSVFEASVWGSQIESTSPYKYLHFEAMGSALVRLDKYSDAASAYAAAWQGGFQSPVVLENYRYAKSLAENRILYSSPEMRREIEQVPPIEGTRLGTLIIELSR